jgi:hypothetical protein
VRFLADILGTLRTDAPVRRVLVGAHLTVVCKAGCGMVATLLDPGPHAERSVRGAGRLTGGSTPARGRCHRRPHPPRRSSSSATAEEFFPL